MPKSKHDAHSAPVKAKASARRALQHAKTAHKAKTHRPIELYFWPTYNGLKISIMLEECELPYEIKGININRGEQFDEHFLSISPNNRIPAIVDPDGPGGKPISIFESGAILQYLGRKTGKFYPKDERARVEVDQWLFWQCAGFGPMAGQAHHFREYAADQIHYAIDRYTNEMNRLYGVMNKRLVHSDFLAGDYSIADMACWGVVKNVHRQGQTLEDFPNVNAWWQRMNARPGVQRGSKAGEYLRKPGYDATKDPLAAQHLFGQTARLPEPQIPATEKSA